MSEHRCPVCEGEGSFHVDDKSPTQRRPCLRCNGTGKIRCNIDLFLDPDSAEDQAFKRRIEAERRRTASGGGEESKGASGDE